MRTEQRIKAIENKLAEPKHYIVRVIWEDEIMDPESGEMMTYEAYKAKYQNNPDYRFIDWEDVRDD